MSKHRLLASEIITTSTANATFDGYLNDTSFRAFQIVWNNVTSDSGTSGLVYARLRSSSTDITSNYYRHFVYSANTGGNTGQALASGEWIIGSGLTNTTSAKATGEMTLYHTNTGTSTDVVGTYRQFTRDGAGDLIYAIGGLGNETAGNYDGIKFYLSTGNFATASIRLYGIEN
jgi:hypothetical protein